MLVRDVMTADPVTCQESDTLAEVVTRMQERNCGCLPVLDRTGKQLLGIVTDRDVALCATRLQEPLAEATAGAAMSKQVHGTRADFEITNALETMRIHRVRRLPVVDAKGKLVGLLSLDDCARKNVDPKAVCRVLAAMTSRPPAATFGATHEGAASDLYRDPRVD